LENILRVLWFSWRDIKNPDAGGAEEFAHQVMHRLVRKGWHVTLFAAHFLNSLTRESIDGVTIVRGGGKYTVYNKAKSYYKNHKDDYDVVIDEINIKPFLTPKFVKDKPIFALVHEVAGEDLFYELSFPINYIIYHYMLRRWLSYYKNITTITVSNSTRKHLELFGFKKIMLVPEGLSVTPLSKVRQKESTPTIVFLGRLKRYKLPDHAIRAFCLIKKEIPKAVMWVIGDGNFRKELQKTTIKDITFFGHVNEASKYQLLSKAHLVLVPSVKEGWGLVVIESNAMGVPVVAYDVPGLRDAVRNGETGILLKKNSPDSLAQSAISLLNDRDRLGKLSSNALAYSRQFDWDKTVEALEGILKDSV
jgi:glycosyltransferase involved in cell wall biosynthesis